MHKIYIKEGREKSILRHHPWVFSKAIDKESENIKSGDVVNLYGFKGNFLAKGIYSSKSQIRVRLLSFVESETIDYTLVHKRLTNALSLRQKLIARGNDGVRVCASEGDFLPGLIVDKYNDILVISISSYAMEVLYADIIKALQDIYKDHTIYERSDTKSRTKEGLEPRVGLICGHEIEDTIYVREGGQVYIPIDVKNGHKTGGYLDQRASRIKASTLSKGARVLNCFSYTGGFGLWTLKGGAKAVYNVDVSAHALEAAKQGVVFNHLDPGRCKFIREDVFAFLRSEVEKGHTYDLVILDPPKFAESQSSLKKACRGYQDINRLGLSLVADGGRLLTFSCSGLMDSNLFQKIVADAALEANVEAQIVSTLRQDEDHVVSAPCPESFYLKGLEICVRKSK